MTATTAERWAVAGQVKSAPDIELPHLPDWNYDPCAEHTELEKGCRKCGIRFRNHQRRGIAWGYINNYALLADSVGTGKTAQILGIAALRRMRGELSPRARMLIVVKAAALYQWGREFRRMLPRVPMIVAEAGSPAERISKYVSDWEVCIISSHTYLRDYERLQNFPIAHLVTDDVDGLRNKETQTSYCLKKQAEAATSVFIATGTPVQKRLIEIYNLLTLIGGRDVYGSEQQFKRRYIEETTVSVYNPKTGRRTQKTTYTYRNFPEFVRLLEPYYLRRTADDIDDVDLPVIITNTTELVLYPAQRKRYTELRKGVMQVLQSSLQITQATATASIHAGAKICDGLVAIGEPDARETSIKLDHVMDRLQNELVDDKVVVFCYYRPTVAALKVRLDAAGIGAVVIWGDEPNKKLREDRIAQFWDDPTVRVLVGTSAIEQSLNLQVSQYMINVGQIRNPARMEQLAGRTRRDGSAHKHVFIENLICVDTQEEAILPQLKKEQALISTVWGGEESELYESLSPLELMMLIRP